MFIAVECDKQRGGEPKWGVDSVLSPSLPTHAAESGNVTHAESCKLKDSIV